MKKTLVALAVLAAAGGALAQSSVTLFGIVDVNVRSVSNSSVGRNTTLNNNGLASSRLGFRGVEDLGGGMSASFWLESDLQPDNGNLNGNNKFFARRSTVSLAGSLGEIRLGRDLTPSGAFTYLFDPFGVIGVGGSTNVARYQGQTTFYRADNSIAYWTPQMGGFYGTVMKGLDEGVNPAAVPAPVFPNVQANLARNYLGFRLGYGAGPINAALSYGATDVNATGGKFKTTGIGGSYDFGVAKLMSHYYRDELVGLRENRFLIGASVPMGVGEIRASYVRSDAKGGTAAYNGSDASQLAIGYIHNLSKRTALYSTYSRISNKGAATFAIAGGRAGMPAGGSSSGLETGLRHSF